MLVCDRCGLIVSVRHLVGAVGQLVKDGLGIGPQPGQRPKQAAEDEREQAQALDGLGLRVLSVARRSSPAGCESGGRPRWPRSVQPPARSRQSTSATVSSVSPVQEPGAGGGGQQHHNARNTTGTHRPLVSPFPRAGHVFTCFIALTGQAQPPGDHTPSKSRC